MSTIDPPATERGTTLCRGCGSSGLVSVLDLGAQPLANEMGTTTADELDRFPLHLRICPTCGLGQVGEFVTPERIFGDDYPYLSSTSTSWVEHARAYAGSMVTELDLSAHDLVLEIASNDGYLLSSFAALGTRILGVEPAANVAAIASDSGIPTVNDFFGSDTAAALVAGHGHPRLVVANNVMAHVPNLADFAAGLALLCDRETVITVENPSLVSLLQEAQFDTIYHEHFSYLTAHAVARAVAPHGLELTRVDQLPTHGGSNRYWLRLVGAVEPHPSVHSTLASERAAGLFEPEVWARFATVSTTAIHGLGRWLDECREHGRRVAGYGAAAKGNTFLNAVGEPARTLAFVVDGSPEKQGRYLPGSQVPVRAPGFLAEAEVDDVLVLPWNLAAELAPLVRGLAPRARVWVALPQMQELA